MSKFLTNLKGLLAHYAPIMNYSQPNHSVQNRTHEKKSLLEWFSNLISPEPDSQSELLDILQDAHSRKLIDAEVLSMLEGVFQVADLCARDIMIPRAQMETLNINDDPKKLIAKVTEKTHSRYPVYEGNPDNIIGVLLAKDLLKFHTEENFDVESILRQAVFIPESKHLNVLLQDFRLNRNHLAIVVDEYGSVVGLITIEDVLEQIVGNIEDEFDSNKNKNNIIALPDGRYRVQALTEIDQFNEVFNTHFSNKEVDTIGGVLVDYLGYVPERSEVIHLDDLRFEIQRSDARQIHIILVQHETPSGL